MKIFLGADHRGIEMKEQLYNYLKNTYDVEMIENEINENDDYVDYGILVSNLVSKTKDSLGLLICGNGIGMSIVANKFKGVRCARVIDEDDAYKCRNHNGANMIAFGSNLDFELVKKIVDKFLSTPYATEERHLRRIEKIIKLDSGE